MNVRTAVLIGFVGIAAGVAGVVAGAGRNAPAESRPPALSGGSGGAGVFDSAVGKPVRIYMRGADGLAMPSLSQGKFRMKMDLQYLSGTVGRADATGIELHREDAGDGPAIWVPTSSIGYVVTERGAEAVAKTVDAAYDQLLKRSESQRAPAGSPPSADSAK